jgi:hypothetical protein
MRMSIGLPDALFRGLKILAASRRVHLEALILRASRASWLARARSPRRRLHFPILDSNEPATLNLSSRDIEDLLT